MKMARSFEVNDAVRESRMNRGHQTTQNTCGDCGKVTKGTGTLCKECREDFTDIIGGVN
jgi:predicted amidophosphoribosyltransferase